MPEPTPDAIERTARQLHDAMPDADPWEMYSEGYRESRRREARAVLKGEVYEGR